MGVFFVAFGAAVLFYFLANGYLKSSNLGSGKAKLSINDARFFVKLLAKVAKSDGVVSQKEAEFIKIIFDELCGELASARFRAELKASFDEAKNSAESAFIIAASYKKQMGLSEQICLNLIIYFLNLAFIDGEFSQNERKIINEICLGFDINESVFAGILGEFEKEFNARFKENRPSLDPYKILGVSPDADFETIKKQYRKLARENHPDFKARDGEKVVSDATKKLQEINEAYEILKAKFEKKG